MDLPLASLTCIFLFLLLMLLYLCYKNAVKNVKGFPFSYLPLKVVHDKIMGKISKDVPFTRHVFNIIVDSCKQHQKEGMFMTYITRPILFVFSDEAIKFFLIEKAAVDKPPEYDLFSDVIGYGLGTSSGERWRTHRKIIDPAFHLGTLMDNVPLFNEHALRLVKDIEKMNDKRCVDLFYTLKIKYFSALSESVFGLKQEEENRAANMRRFFLIDNLNEMVIKRLFYPWLRLRLLLPISSFGRKYQKLNKELKLITTNVINDMKNLVASNMTMNDSAILTDTNFNHFSNHIQKSFMHILLNNHLNDPSFTFQDLHAEVGTIINAGFDTITYATLWCLFMLGLHPEVQEKAFDEVQSTTDGYVTYDDTCNLPYLNAVIMETLRLYPVVPIFGRNLSEDVEYGKYKVYKGTTIAFIPFFSQRNPEIFPNPENFEPERFLSGKAKKTVSYIPFGDGIRTCIGKKYAMLEIKIFLVHLLRNFKFTSLDKREDILPCWNIALTPSKHIRMKISSRLAEERHLSKEETNAEN